MIGKYIQQLAILVHSHLGVPPAPLLGDTGGDNLAEVAEVIESRGPTSPVSNRGADILLRPKKLFFRQKSRRFPDSFSGINLCPAA